MGQFDQFLSLTTDVIAKSDFNNLSALQDVQTRLDAWTANNATPAGKMIAAAPMSITVEPSKVSESAKINYF